VLAACGGDDSSREGAPVRPAELARAGLATGVTEANAHLLWSRRARPQAPPGFAAARDRLAAMRPTFWRLSVDWAALQPRRSQPPAWDRRVDGCARGEPPCAPYGGIREALRAVASQQRTSGGFEAVVVLYGVPEWAARRAAGCERDGTQPRARAIRSDALPAYRALVRSLLRLAAAEGIELRWWSAWNEPNHPFFISPQRARCDTDSPALAPRVYSRLVRALAAELRVAPGDQRLVLGDLAGLARPHRTGAGVGEFLDALPDDVVCAGAVWAQHAYAGSGEGGPGVVDVLADALRRRGGCAARARIWVTETGTGAPHAGQRRSRETAELLSGCLEMAEALTKWDRDPRVDVAVQYTFREDPAFPVGLIDAGLTRTYPVYDLWRAWGSRRDSSRPPDVPLSCAA
jgi:hypothetical protein